MSPNAPQELDLTTEQAAALVQEELACARRSLREGDLETALDCYTRSLGLALQLGPATSELVLKEVLWAARSLTQKHCADGLGALGPTVSGVVSQVINSGALPQNPVMEAWAAIASDLGALIGQLGLALSLPAERQAGMMEQARIRARVLDEATGTLFGLTAWLLQI
jgi:hypothetical protein